MLTYFCSKYAFLNSEKHDTGGIRTVKIVMQKDMIAKPTDIVA